MSIADPILIRWGSSPADAGDDRAAYRWDDLAPHRQPADWLDLVHRLASLTAERPALLLRAGVVLPAGASSRLWAAQRDAGGRTIVAALDNFDPALSPLPPGLTLETPLDIEAIDRLCAWLGDRVLIGRSQLTLGASAWPAGAAERLLNSGWRPGEDLPSGTFAICDHVFAGLADRPLNGPAHWPLKGVPPPATPLDALRTRWHLPKDGEDSAPPEPVAPEPPPGPIPGIDAAPVVLHICHSWGGGSERFIRDLAAADSERCHLLLTAHGSTPRQSFGEWLELRPAADPTLLLARFPLAPPIDDSTMGHAPYRQILAGILERWCVDAVMVSSLIGHDLAALTTGRPTVVVCHDYYPLWPELHRDFGDVRRRFDLAELERDLAAGPLTLFKSHSAKRWWRLREALVSTLLRSKVTLVTPTHQVRGNWLRMAPELAPLDWHVVPHGIVPWPTGTPTSPAPPERKPLRILVPGRIGGGKGLALVEAMMDRLDNRVEFVFLGAGTAGRALYGRRRAHIIHDYSRDELPDRIRQVAADLALLPATVAETFGYLLSELQSLCIPVLATAIGSYRERIRDSENGLLAEPDAEVLAARIEALIDDRRPLAVIRRHLTTHPARTTSDMAADYRRLLPVPRPAAQRLAAQPVDAHRIESAWLMRRALETEYHRDRLHALLKESAQELDRRANWGFKLQRDFDERSRWALSLQGELDALRVEHDEKQALLDTVFNSRSWRLMGPFRVLARRMRAAKARLGFNVKRTLNLGRRIRVSVATRGLVGTVRHLRQRKRSRSLTPSPFELRPVVLPTSTTPPARLPTDPAPVASIVIPVYGKLAYTCACLASLVEHVGPTPIEVIVVDDGSPDDSADTLEQVDGLRLLRNAENQGFVGSCNAGAAAARGRWLVFLNNDTTVTAGWLEMLLTTFEDFPDAGLVGARLVYPDGRLQESGGLVFSDGSGWNYGRFGDPADPRYGYARVTDYCSGAAIAIERECFERLGGFDTRYAPAYYEDTDLAFKVREAGMQVVCQPGATVIHYEGVTSGTDTSSGIKRHQVVNQEKFRNRWRTVLAGRPAPGTDVDRIAHRAPRGRVLVIDATTPEPDQDSGSVRLTHLMRLLRESGRHVTFFAHNRAYVPGYTEALQRLGIEVLYHPWLSDPVEWLRQHGPELDAVLVCRHYIAASYLDLVRQFAPKARFIFDTVDLHYLREARAAALTGSEDLHREAARTRAQELQLIRAADVSLVVSPAEQALLATDAPGARVEVLSNVHPIHGCRRGFSERRDLLFVGGFQHPPNIDAVTWFVTEVFPAIRTALPEVRLHVIGSRMPPSLRDLAGGGVEMHGYVKDLEPYLDGCRIALAPLRYGAGVKGKVNMSMSYGQPVVATGVAVEGMHLAADDEVLVADTAAAFAQAVVTLYQDEALWQRLSAGGLDNVRRHFSFDAARTAIDTVFAASPRQALP